MPEQPNASERLRELERYMDAAVQLPPALWALLDAATKRDTEGFATAYESLRDCRKGISKATRGREILLEAGIGPVEYCGRQGQVFADIADSLAAEIEAQIGDFPQERTSAGLQARDGLVVCRLLSVRELADLVRLIARECLEAKKTLGAAGPQTPEGPAVKLSSCPALDRAHPVALQCLQNVFILTSAGLKWSPPGWPPAYQSNHERLEYSLDILEMLYPGARKELRAARVISPQDHVTWNKYGEVFCLDVVVKLARDVNEMITLVDRASDGNRDRFEKCPGYIKAAFLGDDEDSCVHLEARLKREYEDAEAVLSREEPVVAAGPGQAGRLEDDPRQPQTEAKAKGNRCPRGQAPDWILDYLCKHHQYDGQSIGNWEPLQTLDQVVSGLDGRVGKTTVSKWFKAHFCGIDAYKAACQRETLLPTLQRLRQDFDSMFDPEDVLLMRADPRAGRGPAHD